MEKKLDLSGFSLNYTSLRQAGNNSLFPKKTYAGVINPGEPSPVLSPFHLPSNLYVQRLGFVCRQEWQLEKVSSIPFRIRLGSLAYTDYMEQKPNASRP